MSVISSSVSINSSPLDLEELFQELTILANQIKKAAFKFHDEDVFLAVGRDLLESLLEHGPLTVPGLAALRNSSRQNVQIMVNRLVRLGCVEVRRNPEHKKSGLVCLTETGRAALTKTNVGEKALFEKVSRQCSEKEIQAGLKLVTKLRKALADEAEPEGVPTNGSHRAARGGSIPQPRVEIPAMPEPAINAVTEETEVEENSLPYNLL
jgi:DNA-binding MarR family transcriptional regulator